MNIYRYDKYGVYTGGEVVDAASFINGSYTTTTPPESVEGETLVWDGEQWRAYLDVPANDVAITEKLQQLAAYRYQRETGGVTVGSVRVNTDRESQAMLTGAWVTVQKKPEALIDWKGPTGWAQIDKTAVEALSDAVSEHVQACFLTEKQHATTIATITSLNALRQYDISTGWPE